MAVRGIVAVLLAVRVSASQGVPEVALPARDGAVRIVVAGDAGLGTKAVARGIAAVARKMRLDAVLLVGDNFYPSGVKSASDPKWDVVRPLLDLSLPLFPLLGNHDYAGDPDAQIEASTKLERWKFPARQYAIRGGLADFAIIDTTPQALGTRAAGSPAAAEAVRDVFATSIAAWRIVAGHHTIVSSGWHNYAQRDRVRRMRELLPAFRESHVDLYICGHDHHEELIAGDPPMLISGAGSDPVPAIALHLSTKYPTEIPLVERIGFAVLEITPKQLRVRFYDTKGRAKSEWMSIAGK